MRIKEIKEIITLPIVAARGIVAFPNIPINFEIGRDKSKNAVDYAMKNGKIICFISQKDLENEDPRREDLFNIGVVGQIKQVIKAENNRYKVIVSPEFRCGLISADFSGSYIKGVVEVYTPVGAEGAKKEAMLNEIRESVSGYIDLLPKSPKTLKFLIETVPDLETVTDIIASNLVSDFEDKQKLLETLDPIKRAAAILTIIEREKVIVEEEDKIQKKLKEKLDKNQREYYLREKMKVISKELGDDKDQASDDVSEYYDRIMSKKFPKEVEEKALKELKKLEKTPMGSPDIGVISNYLDVLLDIPFGKTTKDRLNVEQVRKILDKDHDGLEDVKKRIVEYIAALQLNPDLKNQIICLEGPPGTGKTSVASSIAKALNRKFVRISLGGIRDEADIRGHRKTYVGAMPGRLISALIQAKTENPVILMDEVDKLTMDMHGDPAAALLEILDTEQNKSFRDHYVEVPVDFSKCLFITTANTTMTIPPALLDRMEVIEMKIYTRPEKFAIAQKHLIPKQLKKHGLTSKMCKFTEDGIYGLIDGYTAEAGVRNLERYIAKCCRRAAKQIVCKEKTTVVINKDNLKDYADTSKVIKSKILDENEVGTICGMAYTELGGDIMMIEALSYDGQGKIDMTGSLGDVMKESAVNALSYVKSVSDELSIDKEVFRSKDLHINYPETAVPKDGPSAGVATCIAIVSELTKIPVKRDIAVTGEITLRGRVLPIGGVREKTMAAYLAGVKTILLPKQNIIDEEEILDVVKENCEIIYVSKVEEALKLALERDPYEKHEVDNIEGMLGTIASSQEEPKNIQTAVV